MSLNVETDADGRISLNLGEIHAGTETRFVAGDDGVVRQVTTSTAQPEEPAPPAADTTELDAAKAENDQLRAELEAAKAANQT